MCATLASYIEPGPPRYCGSQGSRPTCTTTHALSTHSGRSTGGAQAPRESRGTRWSANGRQSSRQQHPNPDTVFFRFTGEFFMFKHKHNLLVAAAVAAAVSGAAFANTK